MRKFYDVPKNMGLDYICTQLSFRMADCGISLGVIDKRTAGVYMDGEKIGILYHSDGLGICPMSTNPLFGILFGERFDQEYKDTHGFRWVIQWSRDGSRSAELAEKLTEVSRYQTDELITPRSTLKNRD